MFHIGLILLVVLAIYGLLSAFLPEMMLKRRLNRREALSFDEIYRISFQKLPYSRQSVEKVWNEVARDFGTDASKIRPADRFAVELSVKSFPLVDLSEAVNSKLKEQLRKNKTNSNEEVETCSMETLYDYVEFVCRFESRQ
jgi:hypothetical protein